ncbi:MAG: MFS transporter [Pseudomonadota bacterium]|nr:MFS transporter [Pseudomonadota bacterium]
MFSLTSYLTLIKRHTHILGFGFGLTLASSFGQTYFIGVIGPAVRSSLSLSHTEWGTIYMGGTLLSAVLLPWTGSQIDRFSINRYTLPALLLFILACTIMASAQSTLVLLAAVFLLRHSGQGLMNHIAITTMARRFHAERGRAIAIAMLGMALGEAILPLIAVGAIAMFGWRTTYWGAAVALAIVVLPTIAWLLQRSNADATAGTMGARSDDPAKTSTAPAWTRKQVLRDRTFYLLLPGVMAPAIIITAMFFHHLNLADAKGWSHAWITANYLFYAITTVATALLAGPLIDRLGAARLAPIMLLPLVGALLLAALFSAPWVATAYLVLAGASSGLCQLSVSVLWAELYGVTHIGAVRSLAFSFGVFASALGPVVVGALMDLGFSIELVYMLFAVYSVAGSALIGFALARRRRLAYKQRA